MITKQNNPIVNHGAQTLNASIVAPELRDEMLREAARGPNVFKLALASQTDPEAIMNPHDPSQNVVSASRNLGAARVFSSERVGHLAGDKVCDISTEFANRLSAGWSVYASAA